MPIYEYRCEKCGVFEQTQRITDPALDRCPTCRRKVRRLISSTSFQLKGGGWYVTDYARAGKGSDKSSDGDSGKTGSTSESSSSTSSDKAETKSESKPGSTSESKAPTKAKPETKAAAAGA